MTGQCQDAVPLLGPSLDGELPAPDRAWIDEHLAACDSCTSRRALMAAQGAALRERIAARTTQADFSYFSTRVMARIAEEQQSGRSAPLLDRASVWVRELFAAHRLAFGASAGLAAALALGVGLRPRPIAHQPTEPAVALASAARGAHAQADQADIDELEIFGQEGVVLQIPGQSTVIWVSEPPAPARGAE